jgi:raffinose/stachyose/melibiose transport system permease protein
MDSNQIGQPAPALAGGTRVKRKIGKLLGNTAIYLLLGVVVVVTVFPVLYVLLGAFKTNAELTLGGTVIPRQWVFTNYAEIWEKANFALYTANSVYVAFFTTLGSLVISSAAGYCVARRDFPGKKLLMGAYLATMFISIGAVTLRPLFLLMVQLGLHNSLWGIILVQTGAQGTNIFLVSRFMKSVPKELDEAAIIDGCGFFRIYWQIILPLIKPVLGVIGLFSFRMSWNDYILPAIFTMTRPDLRTLTVGVVSLKYGETAATQWNLMLAGASLAILPMLITYILANRTFLSGLTEGAVKG